MSVIVKVLEGRNLSSKDPNALCDPYCIIGPGDANEFADLAANVISEVNYWTLNPKWQDASFKANERSTLRIEVWDKDPDEANFLHPDESYFLGYALCKVSDKGSKWIPLHTTTSDDRGDIYVEVAETASNRKITPTAGLMPNSARAPRRNSSLTRDNVFIGTPIVFSVPDSKPTSSLQATSSSSDGPSQSLGETLVRNEIPNFSAFVAKVPTALESLTNKIGSVVNDWLEVSRALALPAPPPSETRGQSLAGLGKLCKGQWIDGLKFYKAQKALQVGTTGKLALILCRLQISLGHSATALIQELKGLDVSRSTSPTSNSDSALRYITYACAYEQCLSASAPNQLQAAAYALCFLASPAHWKEHLGGKLEEIAWKIFKKHINELAALFGMGSSKQSVSIIKKVKRSIEEKWRQRKKSGKSATLDQLLNMAGIEDIKRQFLEIYDHVNLDKDRKIDFTKKKYNVRFIGNPGTGKTTVAGLYATMLKELEVIPSGMHEISGAKLAEDGPMALAEVFGTMEKDGGGLLFVDRADALDPTASRTSNSRKVLELIISFMDRPYFNFVVIFAGLQKPIEELFAANEGLPSRVPFTFTFPDFTDDQLFDIYCSMVKAEKFVFANDDTKYARVLARKIGKRRGIKGFGNARAVANAFQDTVRRQASRIMEIKYSGKLTSTTNQFLLDRDDVLGAKPGDLRETCAAWQELEQMVGLGKVKAAVQGLFSLVKNNLELEEEERPTQQVALNRLFLGNPGTGKTTVAEIYGRILKDLGLLSKGEVKLHKASDFIGAVQGGSEDNTRKILRAAEGCVLVIDEAYGLFAGKQGNTDTYRAAVINTLVEEIQNVPGEDRCVIMLGYEDQMRELIRESNPGLARRFQFENSFTFEDFNNYELFDILDKRIEKDGVQTSEDARIAAMSVLEQQRKLPHFGNGGSVANLLSQAVLRMRERTKDQPRSQELLPIDFDLSYGQPQQDDNVFAGLIGCENIIQTMREYRAAITMGIEAGQEAHENDKLELNFLFVGPPGTGKTTVARRFGKMFKSLGVLSSEEVVAVSATDLETGYVGQAGQKVRSIMNSAIGRVLFIDEAYRLATDPFLQQAADEIVQMLTEPKFKGKIVVVLAGYEHQMDILMKLNPGLRSRFSVKIRFENFSNDTLCTLLKQNLKKDGLELDEAAATSLPALMLVISALNDFSNGRDIDTWSNRIYRTVAKRRYDTSQNTSQAVLTSDLETSLEALMKDRLKAAAVKIEKVSEPLPMESQFSQASAPATEKETKQEQLAGDQSGSTPEEDNKEDEELSPLSLDEWNKLSESVSKHGRSLDEGIKDLANNTFLVYKLSSSLGSMQAVEQIFKRAIHQLEKLKQAVEARSIEIPDPAKAEERRTEQEIEVENQKVLQKYGKCLRGFEWLKTEEGYRCAGGTHFMSNAEINARRKTV